MSSQSTFTVRRAGERGHAEHGWLDSWHTFSFADYHDPAHMGFRSLRVINEDRVAPGGGFPTHSHRDMEIFSYILEGALTHRDSLGHGRELQPGQIQLMSAGSGVAHSEFNASRSEPVHFLQVWIQPRERGLEPAYTEWSARADQQSASKVLVISPDGRAGSAIIQQDAEIWLLRLPAGDTVMHDLPPGRGLWLQVAAGSLQANDLELAAGDAVSLEQAGRLVITASAPAQALLFDLA